MTITMEQIGGPVKKAQWTIDIDDAIATLRDPNGQPRASFTSHEANEQFLVPTFGGNTKYLQVPCEEHTLKFFVNRKGLAELKGFLRGVLVEQGPEVINAMKRRALRDTIGGAIAITLGIVLTVGSFLVQTETSGAVVFTGLIVFGLFATSKGVHGLNECRKAQRRIDENASEPTQVVGSIAESQEPYRKCA